MTNSLLNFSTNFSWDFYKAMDDSMILSITDLNWNIQYVSSEFCKIFWYTEEEIIWRPLLQSYFFHWIQSQTQNNLNKLKWDLLWIFYMEHNESDIEDTLKNNKTWIWVLKNKTKNGVFVRCKTTIIPILDENKNLKQHMIIQNDITDLELSKQKLTVSYQKLKELDEKKSEFLNIASHELRTPMTAIKWYLSMMLDWDFWEINDSVKKYLAKILDNSHRLLDLINDMLDLAKLESSRLDFALDHFDINKLVDEVFVELNPLILNKNHKLELISSNNEINIETDRNKIKQVIINLLSNAIKFTPEFGNIKVNCMHIWNNLEIDVIDNWIWISEDNQKLIFEKFGQVKNSLTRDISGTWLWLSIVKSTIDRLGWKLKLESSEWNGSKFTIIIPAKFI